MALAIWVISGVALGDIALFAAYELLAIAAPGLALWIALRGSGQIGAFDFAIGLPLGFGIEILGFALAGELGVPGVQYATQFVVASASAVVIWRRRAQRPFCANEVASHKHVDWHGWAVALIAAVAILAIAVASFTQTPLPGQFERVSYFQDLVFQLGLAAEALNHWPITDPKVAGEALPYHTFVDMHMASASRATGVDLPVVLFRLYLVPLVGLLVLQLSVIGTAMSGRRWVGPAAAFAAVLIGEIDPSPDQAFPFLNTVFFSLHTSPSFLYSLPFFLAAIGLIWMLISAQEGVLRSGAWTALIVILVGASGAKATILPVLVGGLGVHIAIRRVLTGQIDWTAAKAMGLAALIFLASYLFLYKGETGGLTLDLPGSVDLMRPTELARSALDGLAGVVVWPALIVIGILGFCGWILVCLGLGINSVRAWFTPWRSLLVGVFVSGFVPFLLFQHQGSSQNFFVYNSLFAGSILAADGVASAMSAQSKDSARRAIGVSLGTAITVTIISALAIVALGPTAEKELYAVSALVMTAALIGWAVVCRYSGQAWRGWVLAIPVTAILTYGMLDGPLDVAPDLVERAKDDEPLYSQAGHGLSTDLLAGLEWLRENTDDDAEIAVNNQFLDAERENPGYMYYSAFAERRVFLEGWGYTVETSRLGVDAVLAGDVHPFPGRLRLNQAVFERGDSDSVDRLMELGVDYVVVDRLNGGPDPAFRQLVEPAFANNDVEIFRTADLRSGP